MDVPSNSIDAYFYTGHPGLQSISDQKYTILDRFEKLNKQYELDILEADYTHWEIDKTRVKREWYAYCVNKIRKITNIESRMDQYSISLYYINGGSYEESRTDAHEKTPSEKEYDLIIEKIANINTMENYYAKFISDETYKSIKQATD